MYREENGDGDQLGLGQLYQCYLKYKGKPVQNVKIANKKLGRLIKKLNKLHCMYMNILNEKNNIYP